MDKMTKKILIVFVVVVAAALLIFAGVRVYQQKETACLRPKWANFWQRIWIWSILARRQRLSSFSGVSTNVYIIPT